MRWNWSEMAGFFFTFIEECCVVIEKNIDQKLANRISYQIWYKRCLKGKFGRRVQICEVGSISVNEFGLERGPNLRWHRHNFNIPAWHEFSGTSLIFWCDFFWHDSFMAPLLTFSIERLNTWINASGHHHRRPIVVYFF